MKKYNKVIMYIAYVILFYTVMFSAILNIKRKLTIVEMQKINSQWIIDTIEIPENCKLMIVASGGTYSLDYKEKGNANKHTIRGGIIDFKIIRTIRKKQ